MELKPDPKVPGLWRRDPQLIAGVHALVVGISDYPYLEDGSAPQRTSNSGGLGQLEVCAKTAARFFAWIAETGEIAGAPVATCRLLLAPGSAEKATVDELCLGHYASPGFDELRGAIEKWGDDLYAGGKTTDPNVALFFFSGHGVEHSASPAILAGDIFNQGVAGGGANRAFAIESLSRAIKTYGIDRALFFVDACRDAPIVAQLLNIVGEAPLKATSNALRRPDAVICLQSTASGLKSYQHQADAATIFGQAVLEALEGPPPSYRPYDTTAQPWRLVFQGLEEHVKGRVRDILSKHTATLLQPVEPYGNPYNGAMVVAQKHPPTLPSRAGDPPVPAIPPAPDPASPPHVPSVDSQTQNVMKGFRSRTASDYAGKKAPNVADLKNGGLMHGSFRHESITDPWTQTLQIIDARTHDPLPNDVVTLIGDHSEERENRLTAWLDVLIQPKAGSSVWLSAGGRPDEPGYAVILPRDLGPFPVRLDVTYEKAGSGWHLKDLSARVADPAESPAVPDIWSALWTAQRIETFTNLAGAGRSLKQSAILEQVLDGKYLSPVAAAIAAATLLRCGDLDRLHDWPRNLANWFEWLPDGPVLWAETLLRRFEAGKVDQGSFQSPLARGLTRADAEVANLHHVRDSAPHKEARTYFAMLADRGPPLLSPTLIMARQQAGLWRQLLQAELLLGNEAYALAQACENVERAATYTLSGGTFARFASAQAFSTPEIVLGAQRRPQLQRVRAAA